MDDVKILIVEDEEDIRFMLKDHFLMKGYVHIFSVSLGAEAIVMIAKENPDIVFLDIQLEDEVDGIEVLKQCRVISPATRVVVVSAFREQYGKIVEDLGAYKFIKKPIKIADLTEILDEIPGRRK